MPYTQKECDWDDQNMVEVTQTFYSAGTMATAQSAYCMGSRIPFCTSLCSSPFSLPCIAYVTGLALQNFGQPQGPHAVW